MSSGSSKEVRRLLDEYTRHVESLKYLNQEFLGVSDLFLVHIVTFAMDSATRMAWEATQKRGKLPQYSQTISFLQARCQMLENCENAIQHGSQLSSDPSPKITQSNTNAPSVSAATTDQPWKYICNFCEDLTVISHAAFLRSFAFDQRIDKVRTSGACFNCLRKGHTFRECLSMKVCQKCQKQHHTKLHREDVNREPKPKLTIPNQPIKKQNTVSSHVYTNENWDSTYTNPSKVVFLQTAVVNVFDKKGQ